MYFVMHCLPSASACGYTNIRYRTAFIINFNQGASLGNVRELTTPWLADHSAIRMVPVVRAETCAVEMTFDSEEIALIVVLALVPAFS